MTPCVIVPTFWTRRRASIPDRLLNVYGHPTPVDEDGPLPECLASLERTCSSCRVIVLVATTDSSIEMQAEERVHSILAGFPGLDAFVFGPAELGSLHRRMEQLEFADLIDGATLLGYGAVRNAGLMVAASLGSEVVIFIDDDQVVVDSDFLDRAMYGLGKKTQKGTPVLAKTGYYVDSQGSHLVEEDSRWTDRLWRQAPPYNATVTRLLDPPRLRRSPIAFGGCLALHADMYRNVSFDPWVVRGEDIDYVINVKMHGGDVFMDNEWSLLHQPPPGSGKAIGFRQDVYRFVYEHRKLEFAKSQVDLRPVSSRSLQPYPGEFVGGSVGWRAAITGVLRALSGEEASAHLSVARAALADAPAYAREHCQDYFAFQRRWPLLMERIWDDIALRSLFTGERRLDKGALTGRFPSVRDE
jgi:GT2 family glycosyltransferase